MATSAHQIEGGNFNSDWWHFEKQRGRIRRGETSAVAVDHWHRLREDVALLKSLGVNSYRMSIEWAKIEPRQDTFDQTAIAHYREEISLLQAAGIEPIVTLHHFTFPQWVRARGGFEWTGLPKAFARFAALVYTKIAPQAETWVTVNEPMVNVLGGYVAGVVPPAVKRDINGITPVLIGVLKAHAAAYHRLHNLARAKGSAIRIGMAHQLRTMDPLNPGLPTDLLMAHLADEAFNWSIPEALATGRFRFNLLWKVSVDENIPDLRGTQDFIGINYYTGDLVHLSLTDGFQRTFRQDLPRSDLGWPIDPAGFLRVLRSSAQRFPGQRILITENGIADAADTRRASFLRDHLSVILQALREGIPVEGYCHWSLYDNFEWIDGYDPRFGLFAIDYRTMERKPRRSAKLFAAIAKRNRLE